MRDWDWFLNEIRWFLQDGDTAVVGNERRWERPAVEGLPQLSDLLNAATVTSVTVSDTAYELLAWGPPARRRGWLARRPVRPQESLGAIDPVHQAFWSACGGIVERFGEPESWWLSHTEVLTVEAARTSIAEPLDAYSWIWEQDGLTIPIQADDYYVAAIEGNGNLTLAPRHGGRLLLFAPDHAFDNISPLAGCPEYSLYTFDNQPDLASWIETCAGAWLQDPPAA
ncbi:hypothetical protein ACFCV3_07275 [Kribbella sp. NPDC056345]|uniref:hypothetical protein n=1 Tax=Kribbella sp. NPDC056345 TaxID=3345789 RepID=UPI0035E20FC9